MNMGMGSQSAPKKKINKGRKEMMEGKGKKKKRKGRKKNKRKNRLSS